MILGLEGMIKGDDEWVVACCKDLLLCQRPLDLVPFDHFLLAQDCIPSACVCFPRMIIEPFMAKNLVDFFSRTKYTFPTSPFPINLILSKLPGPTSTFLTLMEFELYVLLKAIDCRIWPADGTLPASSTGKWCPFKGSTMLNADSFLCCTNGSLPISAVDGLSLDLVGWNKPCAFGADATRLNFLASSSFPAVVAWSLAPLTASTFVLGVSGGEGGTLLSLWCRRVGGP